MTSQETQLRRLVGWSRIILGVLLFAAPKLTARNWLGPDGDHPGVALGFRSIGARDVALGVGLLTATAGDTAWSRAGVIADIGDTVSSASLAATNAIPARKLLPGTVLAVAFVAANLVFEKFSFTK